MSTLEDRINPKVKHEVWHRKVAGITFRWHLEFRRRTWRRLLWPLPVGGLTD